MTTSKAGFLEWLYLMAGADAVIAGNRGYGAAAALFGSFTFRLLQIAPCPVLVVPTGGRQRTA